MPNKKILHIEDLHSITEIFAISFTTLKGVDYLVARDVQTAQEMISEKDFDVIICDGTLTEKNDGIVFALEIAEMMNIPVVVYSATDKVDTPAKNTEIPYIIKPAIHELFDYVNAILNDN